MKVRSRVGEKMRWSIGLACAIKEISNWRGVQVGPRQSG